MSLGDFLPGRRPVATVIDAEPRPDRDLLLKRERLTEKFTVAQAELGGIFYEMAIRDHVRLDILTKKAAALQRIDAELAELDRLLSGDDELSATACPTCGAGLGARAKFCANCGHQVGAEPARPTPPSGNGSGRIAGVVGDR